MVFNATFNNISAISWWSVLLVEETRVPGHQDIAEILLKVALNTIKQNKTKPTGGNGQWIYLSTLYLYFQ
jgi:hypothetical protein